MYMRDYYGDVPFMKLALEQARLAYVAGEVPVGAVLVRQGAVIAEGHNRREGDNNALAHAECEVIQKGCQVLKNWRLADCTLYVTLEPCAMCAGAIINARIPRVVYGAADPAAGCVGSRIHLFALDLSYTPRVTAGVLEEECRQLLTDFFVRCRE